MCLCILSRLRTEKNFCAKGNPYLRPMAKAMSDPIVQPKILNAAVMATPQTLAAIGIKGAALIGAATVAMTAITI